MNGDKLRTILLHESGQWIAGELELKADKSGPQAQGSAITYARRYSYSAMIGLHQEDDDGEGAENRKKKQPPKDNSKAGQDDIPLGGGHDKDPRDLVITEPQRKRLFAISQKYDWKEEDVKELIEKHGFASSKDITRGEKYQAICEELEHAME